MNNQNGGLKLVHPDKKGFLPVYDMITAPSSELSLLTATGLSGFLYNLDVTPDISEYTTFNDINFDVPVEKYVIKFVILGNDFYRLSAFNDSSKKSETVSSFYNESKLQQSLWEESIAVNRYELTTSVANFALFQKKEAQQLIELLKGKLAIPSHEQEANLAFKSLEYMSKTIKSDYFIGIGALTMPTITQSTTFSLFERIDKGKFFFGVEITENVVLFAVANIVAQLIMSFIMYGIINFDLHSSNVMVYVNSRMSISTKIIDFGDASDIESNLDDKFLTIDQKVASKANQQRFLGEYFDKEGENNVKFVANVMRYLTYLNMGQMSWYDKYSANEYVLNSAATIIRQQNMIDSSSHINPDLIKRYREAGHFVNFNNPVNSFFVGLNYLPVGGGRRWRIRKPTGMTRKGKRNKKGRTKKRRKIKK
jgi:hypothetical protein